MDCPNQSLKVIERCRGIAGELQLQRRGSEYEIIYNGVFLMATYNGASERAAVREALQIISASEKGPIRVLLAGLGVGYSLQEALTWEQVSRVTVAEIEPAVIRWNRGVLREVNGSALEDKRVVIDNRDFREVLEETAETALKYPDRKYRVIIVDTDNGSSWISIPGNVFFYSPEGLKFIESCLHPGGVACFWCSRREKEFEERLKDRFQTVRFQTVTEKTGQDGCYYLCLPSN